MGRNCACDWRMSGSTVIDMVNKTYTYYEADPNGCICEWKDWISIYDWPPERKNKDKPLSHPLKDGKYLVRIQTQCGDRYETESVFSLITRTVPDGYINLTHEVHWEGDYEAQPYAWKEIE